jgi:hypothetical protein
MRSFRRLSFETYGVDPAYFIFNSASAWKVMLKNTGARLELLQTSDQYEFFEGGLRGGLAMTRNRYFKCNRPDLPEYDETHPTKTALDLDANALYVALPRICDPNRFIWYAICGHFCQAHMRQTPLICG